jgi:beta-lactamase class A
MLSDMNALLLGDQLSKESGQRLKAWMVANTTGAKRLRAGLSSTWRVGDKTGTGENGAAADIAILLQPDRAPILVAVYLAGSTKPSPDLNGAFADVGRIIADAF